MRQKCVVHSLHRWVSARQHFCVDDVCSLTILYKKLMLLRSPQRDDATFTLSVGKNLSSKTPERCSVCPWALLVVMANAGRTWNWRRRSVNDRPASVGDSGMRGMNRILPEYSPHAISAVMHCGLTWRTIYLAPLQWPSYGSMFRSSIITAPSLMLSSCGVICVSFWRYDNALNDDASFRGSTFPCTSSPKIGSSDPLYILHRVSYGWPPKPWKFRENLMAGISAEL